MSKFHLHSQNQTGSGSGVCQIVFLSAKVQTSEKLAAVWKMSPHLNTVSIPFPLVSYYQSPSA